MRLVDSTRFLAGAVEAIASSGGQMMPPLMGAGAFVMVELTGVPYTSIKAAALLPALLYFAAVWIGINAFASRHELKPSPADERADFRTVLVTAAFFAAVRGTVELSVHWRVHTARCSCVRNTSRVSDAAV